MALVKLAGLDTRVNHERGHILRVYSFLLLTGSRRYIGIGSGKKIQELDCVRRVLNVLSYY